MRKNKFNIRYCIFFLMWIVLACSVLAGCGVRDSVILLPEDKTVEAAEESGVSADSGIENVPQELCEEGPTVYVHVCGAVVTPQVVELPEGSRVKDALEASGGFSRDADQEYLNLARKVTDGEKLYFPTLKEAEVLEEEAGRIKQGLVDINTAGLEELMTLPGIGESRAKDILAYREANGDFERKEDLQMVPGIKENMYAKLKDKIFVR